MFSFNDKIPKQNISLLQSTVLKITSILQISPPPSSASQDLLEIEQRILSKLSKLNPTTIEPVTIENNLPKTPLYTIPEFPTAENDSEIIKTLQTTQGDHYEELVCMKEENILTDNQNIKNGVNESMQRPTRLPKIQGFFDENLRNSSVYRTKVKSFYLNANEKNQNISKIIKKEVPKHKKNASFECQQTPLLKINLKEFMKQRKEPKNWKDCL